MRQTYEGKRSWIDKYGLCVWNGEWGPAYARKEYDGEETDRINERMYLVLKDQLEIYKQVCACRPSNVDHPNLIEL